jgi:hypothetical protein
MRHCLIFFRASADAALVDRRGPGGVYGGAGVACAGSSPAVGCSSPAPVAGGTCLTSASCSNGCSRDSALVVSPAFV